jgi:hypothetical protein
MIGYEGFLDRAPLGVTRETRPAVYAPPRRVRDANVTAQYSKQKPRAQSRADRPFGRSVHLAVEIWWCHL